MIRKIITPATQNISLEIPQEFVGKEVEIVAFLSNNVEENIEYQEKLASHLLSEQVLAKDWLKKEEDQAWKDL